MKPVTLLLVIFRAVFDLFQEPIAVIQFLMFSCLSKVQVRIESVLFPDFAVPINYPRHASKITITREDSIRRKTLSISWKGKIPPPVGLEPTTFELEVQHASPLRHGGFRSMEKSYSASIYSVYFKTPSLLFVISLILTVVGFWDNYYRNITISVQLSSPKSSSAAVR